MFTTTPAKLKYEINIFAKIGPFSRKGAHVTRGLPGSLSQHLSLFNGDEENRCLFSDGGRVWQPEQSQ